VAHNRALTFAARRPRHESLSEDEPIVDRRPGPDVEVDRAQQHERLMAAIRRLPEPQRQTVMLYLDEFSAAEIAAMQGTTENNVAVRLTRARHRLRELLGEDDR
jgi:RNA polymerase sigma-70 factor (ECF subfamily)